jgi:hypothetical protein
MRSSGHGALFVLGLTLATLACAAPAQPTGAAPDGVLDLEGRAVDPLDAPGATAVVLIFTRTDCPISNRYAPEVRRLYERFHDQGVRFWLVYPDPGITVEDIEKHLAEYAYPLPALRDPRHVLARRAGATITPEAAVFGGGREPLYLGRIDDRYVDLGRARPEATRHDLEQALEAVIEGRPVPEPRTEAIGCFIADLS